MNFRLYFLCFVAFILCASSSAISVDPKSAKCLPQCMKYCNDEKESGIPAHLCSNVCTASCYSGRRRRDVGQQFEK